MIRQNRCSHCGKARPLSIRVEKIYKIVATKMKSTAHELQFVVDFQSIPIRTVKELAYFCVYAATNPFKRPLLTFERSWVLRRRHANDMT